MSIFNRKEKAPQKGVFVSPITSARSSKEHKESSYMDSMRSLSKAYERLPMELPFEIYDYVELVALYNPDYSQSVNNAVTLANPGYNIVIEDITNRKGRKLSEKLENKGKNINKREGGLPGIVKKLLWQAGVYGAMCGEWVLDSDLKDVNRFAFLNPKNIRFFWDEDAADWWPYQKINSWDLLDQEKTKLEQQQYLKLNQTTFYYQSIFSVNNSPYGIPPFFAALENISIQRDMVDSLKNIVRKMGLLGIIQMVIERMPKLADETQAEYEGRMVSFLSSYQTVLNNMMATGGIAHFDDVDVKNLAIAERAYGADTIFKLNEEQIFSGLHSLPSVQGRSYSTTETYANVSYDMILRNAGYFTQAVKYIMEAGIDLMTMVWGIAPVSVKVKFKENKTLQRLQNAQAEAVEYKTNVAMWRDGIIDQLVVAQRHGIEEPSNIKDEPESDVKQSSLPGYEPEPPGGDKGSQKPAGGEGENKEE